MPSVMRLSLLVALAALQASCTPVPAPAVAAEPIEHDCGFQGMTHIFGGIRCYARATAFCSGVLVATRTVQKTITLATPTSTSTVVTSTSTSDPLRPAVAQQPLITSAPSLHKRDMAPSDDADVDQQDPQDQSVDDEDFDDEEYDIGLYNPFNCPAPDALAARADIKLACACLMNRGPSTVTLTETSTVTPAVVVVVATAAAAPASMPKKNPAAAVKAEKKQKPKQKTPPVKVDAPLRKGVYGTREKDLRPFGDDAEPVPFWDKDDGFDHRGY